MTIFFHKGLDYKARITVHVHGSCVNVFTVPYVKHIFAAKGVFYGRFRLVQHGSCQIAFIKRKGSILNYDLRKFIWKLRVVNDEFALFSTGGWNLTLFRVYSMWVYTECQLRKVECVLAGNASAYEKCAVLRCVPKSGDFCNYISSLFWGNLCKDSRIDSWVLFPRSGWKYSWINSSSLWPIYTRVSFGLIT